MAYVPEMVDIMASGKSLIQMRADMVELVYKYKVIK